MKNKAKEGKIGYRILQILVYNEGMSVLFYH